MTLIADVVEGLRERVPAFSGRVEGAADYAELLRTNRLPQVTPAAYVLPLGLQGQPGNASAGAFTQIIGENIGVLIMMRTTDASYDRQDLTLDSLVVAVLRALSGRPAGAQIGILEMRRGNLVSMRQGMLVYQLDFSINDQLRILE